MRQTGVLARTFARVGFGQSDVVAAAIKSRARLGDDSHWKFNSNTFSWSRIYREGGRSLSEWAPLRSQRFPDTARNDVGAYRVQFAANGQCFSPTTATFTTYNSLISTISVTGAPATSSVPLYISGEGFVFPGFSGGTCRFTLLSAANVSVTTPLTVLSTTRLQCATPAAGLVGTWQVSVLQNGISSDPSLYYPPPSFSAYNLSNVRLTGLTPPGVSRKHATHVCLQSRTHSHTE